jgi:CDP-glucose 4,6-dehydratase
VSVLVTGAQGFIGSALAQRLLDAGERVVALRRDADPESRFVTDGIEGRCVVALADLADHESLLRVLNEHEVSTVFHLGAQTIVSTARRAPLSTFESNVRGTYNLLEACREHSGVARVVVGSTLCAASSPWLAARWSLTCAARACRRARSTASSSTRRRSA